MFGMPAVVYVNGARHSGTLQVPVTQPIPEPHAPQSTLRGIPQLSVNDFISHADIAEHSSVSVWGTQASEPTLASFLSLELTDPHAHKTSKETAKRRIGPGYQKRSTTTVSRLADPGVVLKSLGDEVRPA
jgi:hypothetical protein